MKLRKFIRGENFYFQMLNDDSAVILESQAYQSKDARDNGIESVKNNISNAERYDRLTEGGKLYFILKAGNNQEIGRSIGYDDEASLNTALQYAQGGKSSGGGSSPNAQPDGGEAYGSDGKADDYKPLNFYESNGGKVESGFDSFSAEGESYFSYSLDGMIYMISEGYKSDSSRDNGVKSVEKNMGNEARYQRQVHPNGKHFFNLRAGNNQEIATSRWFDSEGEMNAIIGRLTGGGAGSGDPTTLASVGNDGPPQDSAEAAPKKKRKKSSTPKKPKAEKVYISEGNYPYNGITYQLFRSGNNKHYFTFKNTEGKTILLNSDVRGFETPEQGQAKLDQVIKYGPTESNYEGKTTKNDKFYFYLKGEDDKNIAKSFFFNTEEDMQKAIGSLLGPGASVEGPSDATSGTMAVAESSSKPEKREDDYLACREYEAHMNSTSANHDDFITFTHDGEYYFAWVADGKIVMRSEGYTTEKARDNGIESVIKNREIESRFSLDEKVGHFFTVLKAGNHQEIARGCPTKDRASAMYWYPSAISGRAEAEAAAKKAEAEAAAKKAEAEAAAKKAEAEAAAKKAEAEAAAKKAEEEAAAKKAEEEAAAKKAEAAAAAKKAEEEAAAKKAEEEAAALVASKVEKRSDDYLHCKYYKGHARSEEHSDFSLFEEDGEYYFAMLDSNDEVVLRSEGYKDPNGRANGIKSVLKNREVDGRYSIDEKGGMYYVVLKAGNHQEIGRSCPYKEEGSARGFIAPAAATAVAAGIASIPDDVPDATPVVESKAEPKVDVPEDKEDDYLSCKKYENREVNDKKNNVALFKHDDDGQYYFALYDENGDVKLRSEGFRTAQERDQELSGVLKYHDDEDMYKRMERGVYYIDILYDKTGREVGRSCLKKKGAAVATPAAATAATAVAAGIAAIPDATPAEVPEDKEDDYLSCKEYENRKVNDKKNNVALFKHDDDGQYYFAMYDGNGDVKLRSEGFRTARERDEELSGVLKYHDDKDMYKRKEKGVYYMDILYDKTGREVGRSCLKKKGAAVATPAAAAVATAAAAAVVAPKPTPKAKPEPKPKKVVAAPVKEKVAAAPVATTSGGGFKWWWLLPLLLLPLLWFGIKGCDKDTPVVEAPKVEVPAPKPAPVPEPEPVVAETPKPAPKPAPAPVVAGCNCNEKDIAIFKIPNTPAKSVARLGTYPEFGNSHALSPSEFFQKLKDRSASNEVDRQYLNYVFRSMGYRGGFADARASMFTNVTLDRGQKGLLGLGEQHHYEYSALNTNEMDRRAFHIKSANGCDVHFMKTCGNYMFFCD